MYFSLNSLDIWIRDVLLNELDKNHIPVTSQTIKHSLYLIFSHVSFLCVSPTLMDFFAKPLKLFQKKYVKIHCDVITA